MPEVTSVHIVTLLLVLIAGILIGWLVRNIRSRREKITINSGWQSQMEAQRTEHQRLVDQNKSLMEQNNQYQASNKDAKNRAKELSESVQEAFKRRDALQRDIKDIRSNLETTLSERDQLQTSAAASSDLLEQLADKQTEIARLRSDLAGWQSRVPPLIENFRRRNADAERLEGELAIAAKRIDELTRELEFANQQFVERPHDRTHIEPVSDPGTLTDGRDASNDTMEGSLLTGNQNLGAEQNLRDALQEIKGVGPAIEKTLNEMGIFRYQQIAELSEYDIERVADRLKGFRSRIYREDWIGQARELCNPTVHG